MVLMMFVLAIPLILGVIGTCTILSVIVPKLVHGEKVESFKLGEWLSLPVAVFYVGWRTARWYWLALRGIPTERRYLY